MATVKESCVCGATFEFSDRNNAVVSLAAAQFRRAHEVCRGAAVRVLRAEKPIGSIPFKPLPADLPDIGIGGAEAIP